MTYADTGNELATIFTVSNRNFKDWKLLSFKPGFLFKILKRICELTLDGVNPETTSEKF